MSVRKLPSGKWQADFWYYDAEKNHKRKRKSFTKKNDAILWQSGERSKGGAKKSGTVLNAPAISRTIDDLITYYRARPRYKAIRQSTRSRYENVITNFVRWCKARNITYAIEFTKDTAIEYESHLYSTFKGKGVIHELAQPIHIFAEDLKREEPSVKRNPFEDILLPRFKRTTPRIFTEEELKLIFEFADHPPLYHALGLLLETGMRRGELLHLSPENASGDSIIIAPYLTWKPKTFKSNRKIPLTEKAKEHINFFLQINKGKKYLLTGDMNPNSRTVAKRYEGLLKRIKATQGIDITDATLHTFRRTFGYLLLRDKVPIAFISSLMGHESISTTERLYVGLFDSDIDVLLKGKKSLWSV